VGASILVELDYRALVFVEGKKLENLWKNPGSKARTNDKRNPHVAPGHIGGRRALLPLHHPYSPASRLSELKHGC